MKALAAVLALLALGLASPCQSEENYAWPSTCPLVPDVQSLASDQPVDRSKLLMRRHDVEMFAASIDAYAICLNSALKAFTTAREQAGRTIDPIVALSVADLLKDAAHRKRSTIDIYSLDVSAYNAALSAPGSFDGLSDLNISADLPPASATISLPAGARLISLPAHAVHDSNRTSPDCWAAHRKAQLDGRLEGTAAVGFDVTDKGALINVHLYKTSGSDVLDGVAVICVSGWSYMPAILDGDPVASPGHVTQMEFRVFKPKA